MKKTQAFVETRNGKTALVVLGDKSLMGIYFCVKIIVEGGAYRKHPVSLCLSLKDAMDEAQRFLDV